MYVCVYDMYAMYGMHCVFPCRFRSLTCSATLLYRWKGVYICVQAYPLIPLACTSCCYPQISWARTSTRPAYIAGGGRGPKRCQPAWAATSPSLVGAGPLHIPYEQTYVRTYIHNRNSSRTIPLLDHLYSMHEYVCMYVCMYVYVNVQMDTNICGSYFMSVCMGLTNPSQCVRVRWRCLFRGRACLSSLEETGAALQGTERTDGAWYDNVFMYVCMNLCMYASTHKG